MDIAALSAAMNMHELNGDVGVIMLSKSLDLVETMGEFLIVIRETFIIKEEVII